MIKYFHSKTNGDTAKGGNHILSFSQETTLEGNFTPFQYNPMLRGDSEASSPPTVALFWLLMKRKLPGFKIYMKVALDSIAWNNQQSKNWFIGKLWCPSFLPGSWNVCSDRIQWFSSLSCMYSNHFLLDGMEKDKLCRLYCHFVNMCLIFCPQSPLRKRVYSERKEFTLLWG